MKNPRPVKKKPSEIQRKPLKELPMSTEDWEEFHRGVTLFNGGKFWNAHEAWEQVWGRHTADERLFFQGLIQLAAAYHHLVTTRRYAGLVNNLEKAEAKLTAFRPRYLGVAIEPLLSLIVKGKQEAEMRGEDGLNGFDRSLLPKLQFQKPISPDLLVEIREICRSDEFLEGVSLFNQGYHWEAHERWEAVWRGQEGEAKAFVQAFVQVSSGYSFLKPSKASNALYALEKALEGLREVEHVDCPLELGACSSIWSPSSRASGRRSRTAARSRNPQACRRSSWRTAERCLSIPALS
jgi:predicted metal-dependent hydrolase